MIVGASSSGKFNFIETIFKQCFNKDYYVDSNEKQFREFWHEIINNRKSTKILTLIHSKGYSNETQIDDWYSEVKK